MNTIEPFNPETFINDRNNIKGKNLPSDIFPKKVILGIDIYRYSQYEPFEQIFIPVIFNRLYSLTVNSVLKFENYFFISYGKNSKDFKAKFVSTGDGGFQIFETPIQAIIFSIYFQANVKKFISGNNLSAYFLKLHGIIDFIDLRYAITSGMVYLYEGNYYGPGIISNARILSKDSLNRLLVDYNTIKWFTNNINSVENLMDIDLKSISHIPEYKESADLELQSTLFHLKGAIKTVDLLKIGSIKIKESDLDVYSLHVQALIRLSTRTNLYNNFLITLGNLNTTGIT
ncbi:MAG: hypothetical protein Q8M15_14570 [Bacteroidota bacterium]|nr:hypothetical protein [Bacteroidota bacterium]